MITSVQSLLAVATLLYLFVLPGLAFSYAFIGLRKVNMATRMAISIGLSIAIVPSVLMLLALFDIALSKATVLLSVGVVTFIGMAVSYVIVRKLDEDEKLSFK